MSAKTRRRQARKEKRARHQATRAARFAAAAPDASAGPAMQTPLLQRAEAPAAQPACEGVLAEETGGLDDAVMNGFEVDTPREAIVPELPELHDLSPYDLDGKYQPLPDRVRAGILEGIVTGLEPYDAARLYGIGRIALDEHMREDQALHRDLGRARLAAKLYHLRIIHAAPSSERVRAAKWYLKVRFPEEFDPVIVSRRARVEYQMKMEAEVERRREARRREETPARAREQAGHDAFAARLARQRAAVEQANSAAPVQTDDNKPAKPVQEGSKPPAPPATDVQPDKNRGSDTDLPRSQSVTAA